ncbi:TPA: EAL domain-containing protein [Clostridioides difficile]|uniref:putative bifunctional diguanylate cyclase/phosphodiesterase n=1 Tax=Clostridioides difficile TaxID=1496 RepID=UPI00097FDB4A|nr:GGDEF domain-containing phosphodiesterase [Clostridioides difficile]SJQ82381.1 Bacteriophytochrome cph2 [Clostridioides difficile]HBF0729970.1 EAL domain-containing protein [Clostridioides difficile]HBG5504007.1 EAL domain-containing protein [Clostridioides difficile]
MNKNSMTRIYSLNKIIFIIIGILGIVLLTRHIEVDIKVLILILLTLFSINVFISYLKIKLYEDKINLGLINNSDKFINITKDENFLKHVQNYIISNEKENCVMACFDLCRLKLINDIYGYELGDEVLNNILSNLKNYFGKEAIYGKLKSDVFVLIIKLENREQKIPYLVNLIKNKIVILSQIDSFKMDIKKAIDNADMARLKSKGLKHIEYVEFDNAMEEEIQSIMKIERDLFLAIKNKEFVIHYQPKVNSSTGNIIGSEALIRWLHPSLGMVGPNKFIPIAEKNGLINNIGRWLIQEVFITINKWISEGINVLPVSINLSRVELYKNDLVDFFKLMFNTYNIPKELIELEITETTALRDVKFISERLYEIKSLGMNISLDDFGVGNSNFINLKGIPLDIIKIDRSLILDIVTNTKTKFMVKAIVNLSHDLNVTVICEGVEDMHQVKVLSELGCNFIQGYVFFKPLDEMNYKKLLTDGSYINLKDTLLDKCMTVEEE